MPKMTYKDYGRTGKRVSSVGFGGMRFDMSRSLAENAELVRYAGACGINYFDTAPGYCDDQSERIFGEAFKGMPRASFYVSTKCMPENAFTAAKAKSAAKKSMDRLGVEKIDFYHIWCLRKREHYELAMKPGGQYDGLRELQAEGRIGHIVCSAHQIGSEIRRIAEDRKLEGILLGANVLNFPYRWEGVQAAYDNGLGIVAMNPLGGGLIPKHRDKFAFLAEAGETPVDAALRFMIACPQITVTLGGFTTRQQIDQAVKVAATSKPFSAEQIAQVRAKIGEHFNSLCTGCGYCSDCVQGIPVAAYMQIYNEYHAFGADADAMAKSVKGNREWGILMDGRGYAKDCIGCAQCERACTQHLPIIDRLAQMAEWER